MDWTTLIISLIGSIITGSLSYFASIKESKAKIIALNNEHDVKLKEFEVKLQEQEITHKNELEKMQQQFEINKALSKDDMTNKMTEKFISGELDISKLMENMAPLMQLKELIDNKG